MDRDRGPGRRRRGRLGIGTHVPHSRSRRDIARGPPDRQPQHHPRTSVMKRILASFLLSVSIAFTQPAITSPQIGFVLDSTHAVRPVLRVAGNFSLGDPIRGNVVSSVFLGSFGIVKTESTLAVFDVSGQILFEQDAPAGPALFGPQLVYLTQTKALLRWTGAF